MPGDPESESLSYSMQPRPITAFVCREHCDDCDDGCITAIARVFAPEDVARCRLCPVCTACPTTGVCLITTREYVSDADAPFYAIAPGRFRRQT